MDLTTPTINQLFSQLGLDSDDESIEHFIDTHKGLNNATKLADADFWSAAQSSFLIDAVNQDADWAEIIDQLDARLR